MRMKLVKLLECCVDEPSTVSCIVKITFYCATWAK
jgi:hypothetical protein